MGFFSIKKEVKLEDFCKDFYEHSMLNPKMGNKKIKIDSINSWAKFIKKSIIEFDKEIVFNNVDSEKLTYELTVISFELFALAWIHSLGDEFVLDQSIFTNKYLKEKNNIWNDMKEYNRAIGNSVTSGVSPIKYMQNMTDTSNFLKKQEYIAKNKGLILSDSVLEIIRRPMYRKFSKKAWESGATRFVLNLVLCQRLGLAEGNEADSFGLITYNHSNINFGINDNARLRLSIFVYGIYENAKEYLNNIKIIN